MNKADLITALHCHTHQPRNICLDIVDAIGPILTNALTDGEEVTLPGIGKLKVQQRAAREGRNPKTLEVIPIAAKKVLTFYPTARLKELIATS